MLVIFDGYVIKSVFLVDALILVMTQKGPDSRAGAEAETVHPQVHALVIV